MSNYNKLLNNLDILKLENTKNYLSEYLDNIVNNNITFLDGLLKITDKEIAFKDARAKIQNVKTAAFPFQKELSDFDFDFQPGLSKEKIMDLATLRYIEEQKNILFVGNSGVGKTHLAVSLGIEAAKKRISTYFISCNDLIQKLLKAHQENREDNIIRHYLKYKLLIIDEIGYLPINSLGANLFFQLIAKRYEKKSTIITTNQTFSKWGDIFSDKIIANAILDRLLHHSEVINITGPSYRVKDKIKKSEIRV